MALLSSDVPLPATAAGPGGIAAAHTSVIPSPDVGHPNVGGRPLIYEATELISEDEIFVPQPPRRGRPLGPAPNQRYFAARIGTDPAVGSSEEELARQRNERQLLESHRTFSKYHTKLSETHSLLRSFEEAALSTSDESQVALDAQATPKKMPAKSAQGGRTRAKAPAKAKKEVRQQARKSQQQPPSREMRAKERERKKVSQVPLSKRPSTRRVSSRQTSGSGEASSSRVTTRRISQGSRAAGDEAELAIAPGASGSAADDRMETSSEGNETEPEDDGPGTPPPTQPGRHASWKGYLNLDKEAQEGLRPHLPFPPDWAREKANALKRHNTEQALL